MRATARSRDMRASPVALAGFALYIVGGVDDFLNRRAKFGTAGGFDWFLGGQLVFNDEDLKSLRGLAAFQALLRPSSARSQ